MTATFHRFVDRNPMAAAVAGVATGLAAGPWAGVAAGLAVAAWVVRRHRDERPGRQRNVLPFLFAASVLLAGWRSDAIRGWGTPAPPGWAAGTRLTLDGSVGRLSQPPPGVDQRAWFDMRGHGPDGRPLRLRVFLPDGREAPLPGSSVRVSGTFHPPRAPRNPGEWDEATRWRQLGITGGIEADEAGTTVLRPAPWWHPLAFGEASRRRLAGVLSEGIDDPDQRAVVLGMALGLADGLGDRAQQSFRRTGSLHLFAVSGLHVCLLAGVVWAAASACGLGRQASALVILPAIVLQALVTGCEPPALRATLGTGIFLVGLVADRSPRVLNSLAAAAAVLLVADPRQVHDLSFQLTFCVALALVLLGGPLVRGLAVLGRPDPFLPEDLVSPWQRRKWGVCRTLTSTFAIGLAANIGSLPLSLHHFNLVTPSGLVLGFVLVPLSSLILAVSLLSLVPACGGLAFLSVALNQVNAWLAALAIGLCQAGATVPGAWWLPPAPVRGTHDVLVFDLDKGGSSLLVRGPGASLVVDTGNPGHARRVLAAACARLGAMPPEGIVLTHEDVQHRGGFNDFTLACGQPRWLLAGPSRGSWPCQAGTIDVLFPPDGWDAARADDRASVALLRLGNARLLWLGDAGFATQKWFLAAGGGADFRCDVLCVGWHAADIGLLREFAAAAAPRLAIFHRARQETLHPPDAALRQFLCDRGIEVWDQEETGSVSLSVFADRIEATAFLQPARHLTLPVSASSGAGGGSTCPGPATGSRSR